MKRVKSSTGVHPTGPPKWRDPAGTQRPASQPITQTPMTIHGHVLSRIAKKVPDEVAIHFLPSTTCTLYTLFHKMLSAKGIRNACPKYNVSSNLLLRRNLCGNRSFTRNHYPRISSSSSPCAQPRTSRSERLFSTSRCLFQEEGSAGKAETEDIERVVRDAKQRFRDTLPKDYLSEEEYSLYVRLYGPPLRETAPEDVGIPSHADMGDAPPRPANEGTLLKVVEGGEFEEITYEIPPKEEKIVEEFEVQVEEELFEEVSKEEVEEAEELDEVEIKAMEQSLTEATIQEIMEKQPGYVEAVARSQREADALQRLTKDFERAQKEQKEAELKAAAEAEEAMAGEVLESEEALSWPEEFEDGPIYEAPTDQDYRRFHPYTVEGSFHGTSVEIPLPREELIEPISDLLRRTHIDHVREAAERKFGGAGLPLSAETVTGLRSGSMGGVGLVANQRQMSEIEADAFMAGFMPAAYASCYAILREVRKRMGAEWIQSKLKKGGEGLSVLDVGAGGAGLIAWEQILNAEWELLKEAGKVKGDKPPGQKTVIAGTDRLRYRLKTFLQDTTFLPRMPDYEHSGEMRGPRLDAGDQQQPRKSYDVIIASHQFLREAESHRRQAKLNNLWHLLKKDGGILIIQEKAHPRGFEAVAHARHTMINSFLLPQSGEPRVAPEDFNPTYHREPEPGHIIAPCTNQGTCPMYTQPGKSTGRKDYCHFNQRFIRPNFYTKMLRKHADNHGDVEFSYVAVQRGVAKPAHPTGKEATEMAKAGYEHAETKPDMQTLPRLVLPALKRKAHVTMDVCTPEGKIERWTVPKSFSKLAYHDARKSRWGDLWALGAKSRVERSMRVGQTKEMAKRAESSRKKGIKASLDDEDGEGFKGRKQPRSKKQKRLDMIEEMRRAEEEEVDELAEEIGQAVEEEVDMEEKEQRRRR